MSRNICITAADGHTGFNICELLFTNESFRKKFGNLTALSLNPKAEKCKELENLGAKVVPHHPGRMREMVETLKQTGADTVCLIPPAHEEKYNITVELIEATKKASIPNVCFISSAGCDLAEKEKQPRLREFIGLEALAMSSKGDPSTSTGKSVVVIRPGFYAENLLLYAPQARDDNVLPLPIGDNHTFAPMALADLAQVAALVLTGKGKNGFSDKHRGQLMVLTGPTLCNGDDLAKFATKELEVEMQFENISEAEAKKVLQAQSDSDPSELQYLLEYYSLVREGKTNYISTNTFHDVTGVHALEPPEFFKAYANEFLPKHADKKMKMDGK